jgi:hypothetical protein
MPVPVEALRIVPRNVPDGPEARARPTGTRRSRARRRTTTRHRHEVPRERFHAGDMGDTARALDRDATCV